MERSFTNRAAGWHGHTTSVTARLPTPVVEFIDAHRDRWFRNRSEFVQHWATVGMTVMSNPELAEALEWALDQVQPPLPSLLDAPMEPERNGQVPGTALSEEAEPLVTLPPNEVDAIHEAQLEALRNRIK